jgi:hypothetical protein
MFTLGSDQVVGRVLLTDFWTISVFCDLDMGKPSPTVLVLIKEKFILWEDVMVAWDEPIRSNRSEEFEADGGAPNACCEPPTRSTAGCGALPKNSLPEATGPHGAWLKALQSPKSPFPLVAVTWEGKLPDAAAEPKSANPPNKSADPPTDWLVPSNRSTRSPDDLLLGTEVLTED